MPSKLADRTDDARGDETFGLTETKEGSSGVLKNDNWRLLLSGLQHIFNWKYSKINAPCKYYFSH